MGRWSLYTGRMTIYRICMGANSMWSLQTCFPYIDGISVPLWICYSVLHITLLERMHHHGMREIRGNRSPHIIDRKLRLWLVPNFQWNFFSLCLLVPCMWLCDIYQLKCLKFIYSFQVFSCEYLVEMSGSRFVKHLLVSMEKSANQTLFKVRHFFQKQHFINFLIFFLAE